MIVDFCVTPPHRDILLAMLEPLPHLAGYYDVYTMSPEIKRFIEDFKAGDFIAMMDAAGIDVAVLLGEDQETTFNKRVPNDIVAELARACPERFVGFSGVDPHKGAKAVEGLRDDVLRHGLRGAMISPWEHLMFADDERYDPIYETCVELEVPIWIHTSFNLSRQIPMEYGHPLHLDRVAVKFPDLEIVAGHAGWPWVTEMVAVAWRHPNVYMEISGIRQKYMGMPGTGWEPLIHYGNSVLQDKVLFATAWPLLPLEQAVQDVRSLPLKEEVKAKWLGENARRLLRL
ncbi:MAG: amidohydrolase family protein [Actinomycetota bacterium]|nr:amidohydrolase family protein [Actinomycetota bacterium]